MKTILLTLAMLAVAVGVQAKTLLAGSFCVSMPTSDQSYPFGVTSTIDNKIELVTLTREEGRDIANFRLTDRLLAKINALARTNTQVVFTVTGIDRYFATAPINVVD